MKRTYRAHKGKFVGVKELIPTKSKEPGRTSRPAGTFKSLVPSSASEKILKVISIKIYSHCAWTERALTTQMRLR